MGESTSDYLVHRIHPVPAVALGFVASSSPSCSSSACVATWRGRTGSPSSWSGLRHHGGRRAPCRLRCALLRVDHLLRHRLGRRVLRVGSGGGHALDPQHHDAASRAVLLGGGRRDLRTRHRARDLTATTLHLGYFKSMVLFAVIIAVRPSGTGGSTGTRSSASGRRTSSPARSARPSPTGWASPWSSAGLGWGNGKVSLGLTVLIIGFVAYLAITRIDVARRPRLRPPAP